MENKGRTPIALLVEKMVTGTKDIKRVRWIINKQLKRKGHNIKVEGRGKESVVTLIDKSAKTPAPLVVSNPVGMKPDATLHDLARNLHLPVEFLENIETLLEEKKQVIFQVSFQERELEFPEESALPDALAHAFTSAARMAFAHGLLHGYRAEESALLTVRADVYGSTARSGGGSAFICPSRWVTMNLRATYCRTGS